MFFKIVYLQKLEISQEQIIGGGLQILKKGFINSNESDNMLRNPYIALYDIFIFNYLSNFPAVAIEVKNPGAIKDSLFSKCTILNW